MPDHPNLATCRTLAWIGPIALAALAFVLKEWVTYFVIRRFYEYAELRSRVAETLTFHAGVYTSGEASSREAWEKAEADLRKLAGALYAFRYRRNCLLLGVPSTNDLETAAANLIGISNSRHNNQIPFAVQARDEVRALLRLHRPSGQQQAAARIRRTPS